MAARQSLTAAAFFVLALFLAVSLVSFDNQTPAAELGSMANLCGSAGKFLAAHLLEVFGAGSFALSFFAMFIGYSVLVERPIETPLVKCLGAVIVTFVLATTIQAISPTAGFEGSQWPLGGVAGDECAAILRTWFGGIGSFLILILLAAASLVLATDRFLFDLASGVPAATSEFIRLLRRPGMAWAGGGSSEAVVRASAGSPAKSRSKPAGGKKKNEKVEKDGSEKPKRTRRSRKAEVEEEDDSLEAEGQNDDGIELEAYEDEGDLELEDVIEVGDEDEFLFGDEEEDEEEVEDDEIELEVVEEADEDEAFSLDGEIDPEEEIEVAGATAGEPPRIEPIIRRARSSSAGDDIEILKLSREKHLEGKEMYALPPLSLLEDRPENNFEERDSEIKMKALKLEETLLTFGIQAKVVEISRGPTITVYEIELAAGTKVKRITALPDDISMALKAKTIRIVAPIPGKATVGIEVPNDHRDSVMLKELARSEILQKKHFNIPLLLGKDSGGDPLIEDLTQMPHLLIAGQTGSGKSVCINSIIASLLLTKYPEEVRLILIDPKMVELQAFRNVPHLLTPVVTDMKKAPKVLEWAVNEMEQRYELLSAASVKDIKTFNDLDNEEIRERLSEHMSGEELDQAPTSLPYVVVIVDELADLMMTSAKEIETSICRLAQKSRAVGIHVILATQRPSVDVITGLIKSNMPSRISFRVASKIDSRTILDQMGADRLLGKGDMLFMSPRAGGAPVRCQAVLVGDNEIKKLVRYIRDVAQPEYSRELTQVPAAGGDGDSSFSERDPLYEDAIKAVLASQRGSVSMLQRKLGVGYTRAARLVDFMAEDGIVGNFKGSKAREVLMTLDDWEKQQGA